ncbi:MAG: hypothetical protein ACXV8Q_08565 [Methylobacter sp.]
MLTTTLFTYDKLRQAIGQSMDQFHVGEYLNYFKNSGYVYD